MKCLKEVRSQKNSRIIRGRAINATQNESDLETLFLISDISFNRYAEMRETLWAFVSCISERNLRGRADLDAYPAWSFRFT